MRILLAIALFLAGIVLPVYADDNRLCLEVSQLSGKLMELRQSGVPISIVLDNMRNGDESIADVMASFPGQIAIIVWGTPIEDTYTKRRMVVENYKDVSLSACLSELTD